MNLLLRQSEPHGRVMRCLLVICQFNLHIITADCLHIIIWRQFCHAFRLFHYAWYYLLFILLLCLLWYDICYYYIYFMSIHMMLVIIIYYYYYHYYYYYALYAIIIIIIIIHIIFTIMPTSMPYPPTLPLRHATLPLCQYRDHHNLRRWRPLPMLRRHFISSRYHTIIPPHYIFHAIIIAFFIITHTFHHYYCHVTFDWWRPCSLLPVHH